MTKIIYIIIALLVGYLIGRYTTKSDNLPEKEERLQQTLDLLDKQDQITNNEVEKLLGISDASAERYLNELEKRGKLVQIGKTGTKVSYRKRA